jgi:hypothetical protein
MHFARTTAWALALLLTGGCNTSQHATLYREGEKQIKVTILSKTGDGIPVTDERELPSGTRVSILDDTTSQSTVKIFFEEGEYEGKEATVPRDAIRRTK